MKNTGDLMSNFQPKQLVSAGREAVAAADYNPQKLIFIHAGISAAVSFLVALMTYLLELGMAQGGGLSGMSHLAALETAQALLDTLLSILSPFWALGFIAAAIHLARRESATPHTLLTGLHRWGPALRMLMAEGLIYVVVMWVGVQIGSFVYMLTPFAQQLEDLLQQLGSADLVDIEAVQQMLLALDYGALMQLLLPMLPFLFLPGLIAVILLSYRMRLAPYVLMDEPRCGAIYAITMSFKLTKKHTLELFRLDLNFWWFYLLELLITALCYGDMLLPLLGAKLAMDPVLATFLFYALALIGQVGLYVWQKPQIFATYALFYDSLIPVETGNDQ